MKVLVLGGSVFLSAAVARDFLERGHDVTCLSRSLAGRCPAGAIEVRADRTLGEIAYEDVRADWDAVVDVATDPRFVRDALSVMGARARHWTFVSSCSVYADQDLPDLDESAGITEPLVPGGDASLENYGAAKAAGETSCREVVGDKLFLVRPGLIVGSGDLSDRGGYWPARFLRDEEPVLIPEAARRFCQTIDVRDLSRWFVAAAESALVGTFNAVGNPRLLRDVLEEIRNVTHHRGPVVVASDEWLVARGVSAWAGQESLPLWIPAGLGFDGFSQRSNVAARREGLVLRSFEETVDDIAKYESRLGLVRPRKAGLSPSHEGELINQLALD